MPAKTYRLKIVREGQEFEAEGDKGFVLEMLKKFGTSPLDQLRVPTPLTEKSETRKAKQPSVLPTGKEISIREFIQQLGFKKHTDITLAFGYYLERFAGGKQFTPADINNCYYEAKIESSNTSQMIIQNIKRGFMMVAKSTDKARNAYVVTQSGERFIEAKSKVAL